MAAEASVQILVDGSRSSTESWVQAYRMPVEELPSISQDEQSVAGKLAIPPDDYRRSKYAADLTKQQLELRASKVGQLVQNWLRLHGIKAETTAVWLKTFEGRYRVEVRIGDQVHSFFLAEETMDDLLDAGSQEAQQKFEVVLRTNFGLFEAMKAS